MPLKLIGTILLVVIVAVLTGFNLNNRSNIWFFYDFKNVPVLALIIGSFVLGVLVSAPFAFGKKRVQKQLDKLKEDVEAKKSSSSPVEINTSDKEGSLQKSDTTQNVEPSSEATTSKLGFFKRSSKKSNPKE